MPHLSRRGIIFALDQIDGSLLSSLSSISPHLAGVKIGHPLWSSARRDEVLEALQSTPLMLDLKFFDIPCVVEKAVASACALARPALLTLHIAGGEAMVRAALQGATAHRQSSVVGVTILTSQPCPASAVYTLVEQGLGWGLTHFVCSPQEVSGIRARFGKEIRLITPGIREKSVSEKPVADDQKRTMTAQEAWEAGADYLVVGRPIFSSSNRKETVRQLAEGAHA